MKKRLDGFITTQEAAKRAGVHTTTIKRWARRAVESGDEHIQIDKGQMGRYRYLIDSEFFNKNVVSERKKSLDPEGVAVLRTRWPKKTSYCNSKAP